MAARSANLAALGSAVHQLRVARGLSQERLALDGGINRRFVGAIERGQQSPTYETLLKLANGLGTDVAEIVSLADQLRGR